MQINNLSPENVIEIEGLLNSLKSKSKDISWQTFEQRNPVFKDQMEERIERIEQKLESLASKLELIFGNHVLVKGEFADISDIRSKVIKKRA